MATSGEAWQCSGCKSFYVSLFELVSHVRSVHSAESGWELVCGVSGCQRKFSTTNAWYRHVRSYHADEYVKHANPVASTIVKPRATGSPDSRSTEEDWLQLQEETSSTCSFETSVTTPTTEATTDVLAGMLIKLKEDCRLSQRAVDEVKMTDIICEHMINEAQAVLNDVGQQHHMDPHTPFIKDVLQGLQRISSPLAGLGSAFRQHSYVVQHFPYVVCHLMFDGIFPF